ncbi:MAG TPA: site-2 protease family protein [Acidimicrobiales bacterium]|nr:site-2 protease family protein [Acidimicrobiales bacterium]
MSSWDYLYAAIPAIVLHEVSHGWVAYFFGDPTAKDAHRLSLNPVRHIDPFGTIILPALLIFSGLPAFGYAKPVPVNVSRLRRPRVQALYVSLAGPVMNLALVAISYGVARADIRGYGTELLQGQRFLVPLYHSTWLFNACFYFGLVNLLLAAFNLIPIPPLDGSAIIERFIPTRNLPRYYHYRMYFLPVVMALLIGNALVFHSDLGFDHLENWWLNRLF